MMSPELADKAVKNHNYRKVQFAEETRNSVIHSSVYGGPDESNYDIGEPSYNKTDVSVIDMNTEEFMRNCLAYYEGKTAVLNFASYTKPGGKYITGSTAQEEAICHATNLYEVQLEKLDYYMWNESHKNKGMYLDRLLYTPDILVLDDNNNTIDKVDIITCAAPNMAPGIRYGAFTREECNKVFYNRILFMLHIAAFNKVDNLILGAWGCGVFRNDPKFVAESSFSLQKLYDGYFKNIVYVIPKGDNYYAFLRESKSLEN